MSPNKIPGLMPTPVFQASEVEAIYPELRKIAALHLRRRIPNSSLQPTALVNEAWLRLSNYPFKSRTHFLALASNAMRRIMVDHVRRRFAQKRGAGAAAPASLSAADGAGFDAGAAGAGIHLDQVLAVDKAVDLLAAEDARKAQVVEMRFFGGMEFAEIAEALEVSLITVKRDWQFARVWLYEALRSR